MVTRRIFRRCDTPMIAHAAMEPRSGAVWCQEDDSCEVWTGRQDAWIVRTIVARTLGLSKDKVVVHNYRIGGAFGGRLLCQVTLKQRGYSGRSSNQ